MARSLAQNSPEAGSRVMYLIDPELLLRRRIIANTQQNVHSRQTASFTRAYAYSMVMHGMIAGVLTGESR